MSRKKKSQAEKSRAEKQPTTSDTDDDDAASIDGDMTQNLDAQEPDECNFCGIRHKVRWRAPSVLMLVAVCLQRLDDLIAKIGFLIHVTLMLSEYYRSRETWWLNFGCSICYAALIYGINSRKVRKKKRK